MGRGADTQHAAVTVAGRRGAQPVTRTLSLQALNKTIGELVRRAGDGELDFSPSYQRGDVWTDTQRVNLIKSVVQGLPYGSVFLNVRDIMQPDRVIDGKQRLQTLIGFCNDEFSVPAELFADLEVRPGEVREQLAGASKRKAEVRYSDLNVYGQRRFSNSAFNVYVTELPGEAEEKDLYERLNSGGTLHAVKPEAVAGMSDEDLAALLAVVQEETRQRRSRADTRRDALAELTQVPGPSPVPPATVCG